MFLSSRRKTWLLGCRCLGISKDKNKIIKKGMKGFTDKEGRFGLCRHRQKQLTLVSVYVPNGGKSDEAYKEKLAPL